MSTSLRSIADEIVRRSQGRHRIVVAIAGPPGSGKSTLAQSLFEELTSRGELTAILPMDGFHLDNGLLEQRGLIKRKGAPETFDTRGFGDILHALRASDDDVLVPVFDRSREIAIAAARLIPRDARIVLAEGNYLLLDEEPWSGLAGLFDTSIFLQPTYEVLESRLRDRWLHYGADTATIEAKLYQNDLPNGERVTKGSRRADITIDDFIA